jgi:hypothetical protein
MDPLTTVLNAVIVFNQTAPALSGLILMFRHPDGTTTALNTLDAADAQNEINIAQAQAFLDANKPDA